MNWFDDPDRLKVLKRVMALNVFAALVNLGVFVWNVYQVNWIGLFNLGACLFSAHQAYKSYKMLPTVKREQEERILNILKGKYV